MRSFAIIAAVAGLAAAHTGAPSYVTEVVTAYTTYCPEATMITHGASTYTVSSATTLTITNCPCTVTRPVYTSVSSSPCPSSAVSSGAVPTVVGTSSYVVPKPTVSSTTASAPASTYTGAASKAQVAGGLLAAIGLVAAAL